MFENHEKKVLFFNNVLKIHLQIDMKIQNEIHMYNNYQTLSQSDLKLSQYFQLINFQLTSSVHHAYPWCIFPLNSILLKQWAAIQAYHTCQKNFTLNTLGIQFKMYFLDVSSKPQKLLKSFFQAESDYCERGCVGGCAVLVWLCSSWCEAEATAAAFKAGFTDEAGSRRSARHPCPPLCQRRSA